MNGATITALLETSEGALTVVKDDMTNSYSIGLRTVSKLEWKDISEDLYLLLMQELKEQKGMRFPT
ncbi:hypothetical protein O0Q50_22245 [Priestia aryabhattai]|uniref:Uncharacterized protein n=1 Tax=Priestia aryabhattai TaxID=412384 RepID=A0AAX6NEH2_PRIAR|nr:hypothetical protein [Priestia aryabhattai]MDU9693905.1 hypothetical protein [Priestia aryabhattai]